VQYIRINFRYEPGTRIQNALLEKEVRIYLSCPTEIARIYRICIPDMRVRIQGYIGYEASRACRILVKHSRPLFSRADNGRINVAAKCSD